MIRHDFSVVKYGDSTYKVESESHGVVGIFDNSTEAQIFCDSVGLGYEMAYHQNCRPIIPPLGKMDEWENYERKDRFRNRLFAIANAALAHRSAQENANKLVGQYAEQARIQSAVAHYLGIPQWPLHDKDSPLHRTYKAALQVEEKEKERYIGLVEEMTNEFFPSDDSLDKETKDVDEGLVADVEGRGPQARDLGGREDAGGQS